MISFKRQANEAAGSPTHESTRGPLNPYANLPAPPSGRDLTSTPPARVLHDFGDGAVSAQRHVNPDGSIGGWVARSAHVEDTATVDYDAEVFGNARVFGDARILDRAQVADNARVYDDAVVSGHARVGGNVRLIDAEVGHHARVIGDTHVSGGARIAGEAFVTGDVRIMGHALIAGSAKVGGRAWIGGGEIAGTVVVDGMAAVHPGARLTLDEHLSSGTYGPPVAGKKIQTASLPPANVKLRDGDLPYGRDSLSSVHGQEPAKARVASTTRN